MNTFLEVIQSTNISKKQIKITFDRYLYWKLDQLFPAQITVKVKNRGYIFFDELSEDQKYQLAVFIFKKLHIVFNDGTSDKLDFKKIDPGYRNNEIKKLSDLKKSEVIEAFEYYVFNINNIFSMNYKNESIESHISSTVFLDTEYNNIKIWETDVKKFILHSYKMFLTTKYQSFPFLPRYGSNIKEYLDTLTLHQMVDMVQEELDILTAEIRQYLNSNLKTDIKITTKVEIKNTSAFDTYEMHLKISINGETTTFKLI